MTQTKYIAKNETIEKLDKAFGFRVYVISSKNFEVHGERRTRYTVKRQAGTKHYHAIMLSDGTILACRG